MLKRHSSRRNRLDQTVLNQCLDGAVSYDRIAGYFRSSLFEVAGEAIATVTGQIRIICNSDIDHQDLATATAAQAALRRSWCSGRPEEAPWQYLRDPLPSRFEHPVLQSVRNRLDAKDTEWQFSPEALDRLPVAIQRVQIKNGLLPDYRPRKHLDFKFVTICN